MAICERTKQDWIQEYAERILKAWQNWQGPLGQVDDSYIEQVKKELDSQFDDPLKRSLIETTY